jgi:hypothetical protein
VPLFRAATPFKGDILKEIAWIVSINSDRIGMLVQAVYVAGKVFHPPSSNSTKRASSIPFDWDLSV